MVVIRHTSDKVRHQLYHASEGKGCCTSESRSVKAVPSIGPLYRCAGRWHATSCLMRRVQLAGDTHGCLIRRAQHTPLDRFFS